MDTKVLFKNRSITSCMKAAYDYIGSHFTSLIKRHGGLHSSMLF